MKRFLTLIALLCTISAAHAKGILIEAESFANTGGWSIDQQFIFEMGSPYLIAHGIGEAVKDATTKVAITKPGGYHIYVRTYNWTSPWSNKRGAGAFRLGIDGEMLNGELGSTGSEWMWQYAGTKELSKGEVELRLHDMTGFDGRCDAIYLTTDKNDTPPAAGEALTQFRLKHNPRKIKTVKYDFVVVGGGVAGMCAAVAATRLGCEVALINDRPIWGGCNSSETRVHLGGHIEMEPYTNLGNLIKEFGPSRGGNAQPAENYEDEKKQTFLEAEEKLTLYPSYKVYAVDCKGGKIEAVYGQHIATGEVVRFIAPIFSDCTGDGTVGYLAGADYSMGRESRADYGEPSAPEKGDKMTMGSSVQWYSVEGDSRCDFPIFEYGLDFNEKSCERVTMGEWTWETGMNYDQCNEFERIRDYGLMVVYSNWSFLKNRLSNNEKYHNRSLGWVAYIAGKRESRRLLGDHVLTENDLIGEVQYPDASFTSSWSIDLHYPDPKNSAHFPDAEFKSICTHGPVNPYAVPYRCLYSRNIDNLFMAGRDISVTHIGLGTVRVMRTTGMMGEVVGMAASLCRKHKCQPRAIYTAHLDELKALMRKGAGEKGLPNNQTYNTGGRWPTYKKE
ncbi:MAG: FAD-dependent oxidoreductase [Alistipes sp.]|nr:FAD-dependent oxidoreductase [Alistipes sp.]